MGRKYALLLVKAKNEAWTQEKLLQTYKRLSKTMPAADVLGGIQKLGVALNEKEAHLFNAILDTFENTVKIETRNGFVTISDRELSFESIEDRALELSKELDEEVFFASVFDDDVFFFGLCRKGQSIAMHASGQCEAYGLEKSSKNIDLMEKWLCNGADVGLNLNNKEGAEFEEALQSQLGFRFGGA